MPFSCSWVAEGTTSFGARPARSVAPVIEVGAVQGSPSRLSVWLLRAPIAVGRFDGRHRHLRLGDQGQRCLMREGRVLMPTLSSHTRSALNAIATYMAGQNEAVQYCLQFMPTKS